MPGSDIGTCFAGPAFGHPGHSVRGWSPMATTRDTLLYWDLPLQVRPSAIWVTSSGLVADGDHA